MKTRYILSGVLMALATVGCTDLDVDIKSVYTKYPTDSEIAIEAKISDAYYAFRAARGRRSRGIRTADRPGNVAESQKVPYRRPQLDGRIA